jgi:hypothetical protein
MMFRPYDGQDGVNGIIEMSILIDNYIFEFFQAIEFLNRGSNP